MVVLEAGGSTGGDLLEQDVLPHTHTTLVSSRQRLDRLIGDHLLRNGLQQTASEYAKLTEVESLVDKQVFGQSSRICEALRRAQIGEALAWCAENKNSLRKRKSRLEFELRKQEFIELCRRERPADAITFAQRNLSAFVEQYPTAVRQATALLCYRQGTVAEPYRVSHQGSTGLWGTALTLPLSRCTRHSDGTNSPISSGKIIMLFTVFRTPHLSRWPCLQDLRLSSHQRAMTMTALSARHQTSRECPELAPSVRRSSTRCQKTSQLLTAHDRNSWTASLATSWRVRMSPWCCPTATCTVS